MWPRLHFRRFRELSAATAEFVIIVYNLALPFHQRRPPMEMALARPRRLCSCLLRGERQHYASTFFALLFRLSALQPHPKPHPSHSTLLAALFALLRTFSPSPPLSTHFFSSDLHPLRSSISSRRFRSSMSSDLHSASDFQCRLQIFTPLQISIDAASDLSCCLQIFTPLQIFKSS